MSLKLEKINQWLVIATNLGIIAGFILVAFQLQQTSQSLQLQASAIAESTITQNDAAFIGETLAESYAVAQLRPDELTDAQMMEVTGYLAGKLHYLGQQYRSYKQGSLYGQEWEELKQYVAWEFNWPLGRAFWQTSKKSGGFSAAYINEIDEALAAVNPSQLNYVSELRSSLERELGSSN